MGKTKNCLAAQQCRAGLFKRDAPCDINAESARPAIILVRKGELAFHVKETPTGRVWRLGKTVALFVI